MVTNRQTRALVLAEYVRIAAGVLGRERITRLPLRRLPQREPSEQSGAWRSHDDNGTRHVLYSIRLARLVAERYGLPLEGYVNFGFVDLKRQMAGRVHIQGNSSVIEIDTRYLGDALGTVSVLAHEFAHVFLNKSAVRLSPERRNEELTDATACLAGFGPIMVQANETTKVKYYVATSYLGYLGRDDLAWLTGIQDKIATRRPFRLWSAVDPDARAYSACPACLSRLRLPRRTVRVLITFPACGLIQGLRLVLGAARCRRPTASRLADRARGWIDAYNGVPE